MISESSEHSFITLIRFGDVLATTSNSTGGLLEFPEDYKGLRSRYTSKAIAEALKIFPANLFEGQNPTDDWTNRFNLFESEWEQRLTSNISPQPWEIIFLLKLRNIRSLGCSNKTSPEIRLLLSNSVKAASVDRDNKVWQKLIDIIPDHEVEISDIIELAEREFIAKQERYYFVPDREFSKRDHKQIFIQPENLFFILSSTNAVLFDAITHEKLSILRTVNIFKNFGSYYFKEEHRGNEIVVHILTDSKTYLELGLIKQPKQPIELHKDGQLNSKWKIQLKRHTYFDLNLYKNENFDASSFVFISPNSFTGTMCLLGSRVGQILDPEKDNYASGGKITGQLAR